METLISLIKQLSDMGEVDVDGSEHNFDYDTSVRIDKKGNFDLWDGGDNFVRSFDTLEQAIEGLREIITNGEVEEVTLGDYTAKVRKTGIEVGCQTFSFDEFDELTDAVNRVRD